MNTNSLQKNTLLKSLKDEQFTPEMDELITLFKIKDAVIVPNKIQRTIERYVSTSLKRDIDKDDDVVMDYCMIFASLITQYGEIELIDGDETHTTSKYTNIASTRLNRIFGTKSRGVYLYTKIKKLLMRETKTKKPFIESNDFYCYNNPNKEDNQVLGFRFTEDYRDVGLRTYQLKTKKGKEAYHRVLLPKLREVANNPIASKIFMSYDHVELPTMDEIEARATELHQTTLKNGKVLKRRYTRKASSFKGNYSFVEDNIKRFKLLTEGGLLVPIINGAKAGHRVTDSFTLMPSWIRDICKIDGVKLGDVECDYTALHPNIALKIYGTEDELESLGGDVHTTIANHTHTPRNDVKIPQLSFFNKRIKDMEKMELLYDFYWSMAPSMMQTIERKKKNSTYRHKITSREMFEVEVSIMTEVINRLDENDHIIYVYDALYMKDVDTLRGIMADVAKEFGLDGMAKCMCDEEITEGKISVSDDYESLWEEYEEEDVEEDVEEEIAEQEILPSYNYTNRPSYIKREKAISFKEFAKHIELYYRHWINIATETRCIEQPMKVDVIYKRVVACSRDSHTFRDKEIFDVINDYADELEMRRW